VAAVILSESQIQDALAALPGWSYRVPNLEADYKFANFRDAIAFIIQVAIEAEARNHHPDFRSSWNKVSFSLCSHDVGNKITEADVKLAKYIDATAARFLQLKPA
jgi:4a-hydroxytetrahydrobiopterin dehydratase